MGRPSHVQHACTHLCGAECIGRSRYLTAVITWSVLTACTHHELPTHVSTQLPYLYPCERKSDVCLLGQVIRAAGKVARGFVACLQAYNAGTQARLSEYVLKRTCMAVVRLVYMAVVTAAQVPSVLCSEPLWDVCCRTKGPRPPSALCSGGLQGAAVRQCQCEYRYRTEGGRWVAVTG